MINVGLGLWQYSRLAYGQLDDSRYYPFWVWIAFIIVYTLWDCFLFIYSKWIGPHLDKMWKKEEKEFEMRPTNADPQDKEDPPKKKPSKVECKGWGLLLVCYSQAMHRCLIQLTYHLLDSNDVIL